MLYTIVIILLFPVFSSQALSPLNSPTQRPIPTSHFTATPNIARPDFIDILTRGIAGSTVTSILLSPSVSSARGRATLEQAYDRYVPRVIAGGEFYKNELKKAIDKNDWSSLKVGLYILPVCLLILSTCI